MGYLVCVCMRHFDVCVCVFCWYLHYIYDLILYLCIMYYTVCYLTGIFYAVVRQISMLFIDNKISVFCVFVVFPSVAQSQYVCVYMCVCVRLCVCVCVCAFMVFPPIAQSFCVCSCVHGLSFCCPENQCCRKS